MLRELCGDIAWRVSRKLSVPASPAPTMEAAPKVELTPATPAAPAAADKYYTAVDAPWAGSPSPVDDPKGSFDWVGLGEGQVWLEN